MIIVSFYRIRLEYLCGMANCTEIRSAQLKDFSSLSTMARAELLRYAKPLSISKGTVLFEEDENLSHLFCIKKGACKFSKVDESGQEHILRFLGDGEVMGKRSIITNTGAKVRATALVDTELCCIDKNSVTKNLQENTKFSQDFSNALAEDVNINEHTRIIFCVHKGIKQRLAQLLLYILNKFGADSNGKLLLRLKREDMAAVLGTSQEYVINLLKTFKNFGLISIEKREIYILSRTGLKGLVTT